MWKKIILISRSSARKNKTVAVLKDENGGYIHHAVAICSPDDKYSFEIGKKIALQRLFEAECKEQSKISNIGMFLKFISTDLTDVYYGKVGTPTSIQAYGKVPLFVGDVVELFDYHGQSFGLCTIGINERLDDCVMGVAGENFTNGISRNGWLIVKRKSFSDMKNGDIIDDIKYVERN